MKPKYILLSLTAVVLVAAGCNKAVTNTNNTSPTDTQTRAESSDVGADDDKETPEHMATEKADYEKNHPNESLENTPTNSYKDYSTEAVATEQKAGQKVVLFFYATWCGECRAIDTDLKAHPEKVPTGVTILKTNYDKEKDLKNRYGIITQHTFVQIDTNGNQIVKWTAETADSIAQKVK